MTNKVSPRRRARRRAASAALRWRALGLGVLTLAVLACLIALLAHGCGGGEDSAQAPTTAALPQPKAGEMCLALTQHDLSQGDLILVNAQQGFDAGEVSELACLFDEKTDSYFVASTDLAVAQRIVQPLNQWLGDFCEATGVDNVNIVAGFRTEDYQQSLRDNAIENHGLDYADDYIALPGHSEHHTGLAVDLDSYFEATGLSGGFDGSGVYQWLVENAWRYGFVQRYPTGKEDITGIAYEQWHFRYVGLPHAKIMAEEGRCLEEYIDYLRGFPYEGEHLHVQHDGAAYEIYFCAGLQPIVPTDREYDISGNNVDGFIVTVTDSASP